MNNHFRPYITPILLAAMAVLGSCSKNFVKTPAPQPQVPVVSMMTYLDQNFNFSMLDSALRQCGLADTLSQPGKYYTLLAPTNADFALFGITGDSLLRMTPDSLKEYMGFYILPDTLSLEAVPTAFNTPYTSLSGHKVYATRYNSSEVEFNEVTLELHSTGTDVRMSNGILQTLEEPFHLPYHTVKDALMAQSSQFSMLIQGFTQFGLLDELADSSTNYVVLAIPNSNFNFNSDSLAKIDTVHYQPYLFSVYILPNHFFFPGDFGAGADPSILITYIAGAGGVLQLNAQTDEFTALPLGSDTTGINITTSSVTPLGGTGAFGYTFWQADNGMVISTNVYSSPGMLVFPANVQK